MSSYNYNQITSSYIVNHCNNLILNLDWNAAEINSWNNAFCNKRNLQQCNLINFYGTPNLSYVFWWCNNLTNLDVSNWNMSNVTNLGNAFYDCNKLVTLDVSNWNTSNVTNLSHIFSYCSKLTNLDVSNWNTNKVTDLYAAFSSCNNLINLNLSNWNTSQVISLQWTFASCLRLQNLNIANWDIKNIKSLYVTFDSCRSLINLNLSNWNVSNVVDLNRTFNGCVSLTNLDISNWNISNVTNLQCTFRDCHNLTTLDVSKWNTSKVTSLSGTFDWCFNLKTLNISNWNVSNVTDLSYMFENCYNYNGELNLSQWNTAKVQGMSHTFYGLGSQLNNYCDAFDPNNCVYPDIANWIYDNVTNLSYFLCNITPPGESALYTLFGIDENHEIHWNTGKVTNMSYAFSFCPSLFCDSGMRWEWGQEVEWYLNTDNVTDLSGAFFNAGYCADGYYGPYSDCWGGCHLNVYLSDVSKVTNAAYCFTSNQPFDPWNVAPGGTHSGWGCAGSIFDISQCSVLNFYNVKNATHLFYNYETYGQTMPKIIFHEVENLNNAFAYSYDIGSYDIINWNLYKAKDISRMFTGTSGMNNEILQDFATVLVNASQVTYKNLYNNNVYSPIYSSSLHINSNTIGTNLIQQLRSNGWTTENEQWTLTIRYYFPNGTALQADSVYIYDYQEYYNIQIPDWITYQQRSWPLMTANQFNGNMPARNVVFTALYNDGVK